MKVQKPKKKQLILNEQQKSELQEAFELFDRDGDQMIAAKELHVVLMAIGRQMTIKEVSKIMIELKVQQGTPIEEDEEPELNFDEFMALMTKEMLENMIDEEMIEAFKSFGCEDENDSISKVQMIATMKQYGEKMTQEEYDLLFSETDKNSDGAIDFNDFI